MCTSRLCSLNWLRLILAWKAHAMWFMCDGSVSLSLALSLLPCSIAGNKRCVIESPNNEFQQLLMKSKQNRRQKYFWLIKEICSFSLWLSICLFACISFWIRSINFELELWNRWRKKLAKKLSLEFINFIDRLKNGKVCSNSVTKSHHHWMQDCPYGRNGTMLSLSLSLCVTLGFLYSTFLLLIRHHRHHHQ